MTSLADEVASLLDGPEAACPECGYDLRGTIAASRTRCPECGASFKLAVTTTRRGVAAWYLMLVIASMLFGGSTLYLAYVFVRNLDGFIADLEINVMLAASPLALALVVLLGWKREWFIRRPGLAMWLVAGLFSVMIVGFLAWWVGVFEAIDRWWHQSTPDAE